MYAAFSKVEEQKNLSSLPCVTVVDGPYATTCLKNETLQDGPIPVRTGSYNYNPTNGLINRYKMGNCGYSFTYMGL